jgi:hypothetical protein
MSASVAGAAPSGGTRTGASPMDTAAFDRAAAEAARGAPATPPPASAPDPGRQQQIDGWVATSSDRSGGVLGIGGTSSAEKVAGALGGGSALGPLTRPEQAHLVDRMLDRWGAGQGDGAGGPRNLTRALEDAPAARGVVGERFALRAAALGSGPATAPQARSLAIEAVTALSGPAYARSGDLAPLRDMLTALPPEAAGGVARLLATDPAAPAAGGQRMLSRALEALNQAPRSEATGAFVQNAFAAAGPADYNRVFGGDLPQQLGQALAREWHPADAGAQAADAGRLSAILGSEAGRELFAAGGSVPLEARVNALARIRMDPAITAGTLAATDDPWTNTAITGPEAQDNARQFLATRGDAARPLAGTDLDNTVGFAMGLPPTLPPGMAPADAEAGAARGAFSYYGSGEHAEAVGRVAEQIRGIAGGTANVAVLPVLYSSGETGPVRLPLFRVTDAAGAERFVDNTGRRYDSFADWQQNNALPPGSMTYPEGGHLAADGAGGVRLAQGNTPKTVDTFGEHLAGALDTAALVGGVIAGGVLIVGSGGLATPIVVGAGAVAVGAGAWGAYRSGDALVDRAQHGQSLNPVTDGEARSLWLSLGANALSVGAFGSAARLAQLGQAGRAIAPLEASAHGLMQAGAATADVAAIANQGVDLARNWDAMSGGERATALLSMGFWAAGTGAGMRAAGTRPGDMFNPVAIRDNLLRDLAPPVAADAALPGNAVRIDYDAATSAVQGIRHGPDATAADIDLHVATAQAMQRSLTLEGQLRAVFADRGEPAPGTLGWAARFDIDKLRTRMADRATELADPNLTPARRAELRAAEAVDREHLNDLAAEVQSIVRDPAQASVAARNTRFADRDTAAERQQLAVGDTTVRYGENEVTWTVNDGHETVRAEAVIREIPPKKERPDEENELTANVGKEGGRDGDFPESDNGGHIIGFQFLHDQGLINMFPQNSQFNQRIYTQFETEMRDWVEAGGEVRVKVEIGEAGPDGGLAWGGSRPDRVTVDYEVINPATGERVYSNFAQFRNEQGQRFDGFALAAERDPDAPRTRKGKVDVPAEMRRLLEQ